MGTSLRVRWLRLRAPSAAGPGLIPPSGNQIPHATARGLYAATKRHPMPPPSK